MSFLAPAFLAAGLAASLAIVALHLLARQRPRSAPLPTARFIPDRQVRAPSRSVWPTDVLLLLLRVVIVMLAAAAFARPVLRADRGGTARVILADRSRAVGAPAEVRDSVAALLVESAEVIVFDTVASRQALDSLASTDAPGSLSTALLAGIRRAREHAARGDSVELVLVSPLVEEAWDAATDGIRALWPEPIRLVRVAPAIPAPRAEGRVVRSAPSARDSAWARDSGGAIVIWPREGADSSGAVASGEITLVAPLGRRTLPEGAGSAVARWVDGQPAALETRVGAGCVRDVGIVPPERGDLVLRASYRRLEARLLAPCGPERRPTPLDSARLSRLAGERRDVTLAGFVPERPEDARLAAMLVALALLLALVELGARRGGKDT